MSLGKLRTGQSPALNAPGRAKRAWLLVLSSVEAITVFLCEFDVGLCAKKSGGFKYGFALLVLLFSCFNIDKRLSTIIIILTCPSVN